MGTSIMTMTNQPTSQTEIIKAEILKLIEELHFNQMNMDTAYKILGVDIKANAEKLKALKKRIENV